MLAGVTGLILFSSFSSVHDVFHSTAFVVARNMTIFLAIVFWLALAFWVYKDARRRIDDPWLVGIAGLLGLLPPYIGPLVYLLFRPAETLDDVRTRAVELRALEEHLKRSRPACPVCSTHVDSDYLVCPVCTTPLRQACRHCDAPLEPLWQMCPYCAHAVSPTDLDMDAALTAETRALAVDSSPGIGHLREPRGAET